MNFKKIRQVFVQNGLNRQKISRTLQNIRMLFKSRDEKRIFEIMNFQKNLEINMKNEYLR